MAPKKKASKTKPKPQAPKVTSKARGAKKKDKTVKASPKKASTKVSTAKVPQKTASKSKPKTPIQTRTRTSVSLARKAKAPEPSKKKARSSSKRAPKQSRTPSSNRGSKVAVEITLSDQDRYNIGGLCACVIDTSTSAGETRLRRVLTYLQLSEMDQDNLYRVSQGMCIPKLFADHFIEDEVRQNIVQFLTQFVKADDSAGKHWARELEDLRRLLGN